MTTTQTATAARFTLTVTVRGWDREIVRTFDKIADARSAAIAAATHPSCMRAEVTGRAGFAVYATRYED